MATYSIQSEGTPILPLTVLVTFPINITMGYPSQVGSYHTFGGSEFNAQMDTVADNVENYYKTLPEFSVQDSQRNRTWQCINPVESVDYPGLFIYDMTVSFTIVNAEVQITRQFQTDLTGTELETFLQTEADSAATSYKAEKNWMDI